MADAKKGGKKEEAAAEYNKRLHYKVQNGKLTRARRACPKCGPGVLLAEHKDRNSCGNCGYTEFKKPQAPVAKA